MQQIIQGDCLEVLPTLPAESVHCCVTSPPYFGLRDYGHDGQIGLESTPDEYVAKLVEVFREVRRVLRDDGTVWLNLGDSYANKCCDSSSVGGFTGERIRSGKKGIMDSRPRDIPPGLKPKDLIGIPWRVAFALQADGWYLRQDLIWHKPNPMPESVTDRCTKAHEYIFLLSKSARYFYDAKAVKERATSIDEDGNHVWTGRPVSEMGKPQHHEMREADPSKRSLGLGEVKGAPGLRSCGYSDDGKRNRRSVWTVATKPYSGAHFAVYPPELIRPCIRAGCPEGGTVLDPFNGSGTTGAVATQENRQYIGIELNPEYIALAENRIKAEVLPLFPQEVQ